MDQPTIRLTRKFPCLRLHNHLSSFKYFSITKIDFFRTRKGIFIKYQKQWIDNQLFDNEDSNFSLWESFYLSTKFFEHTVFFVILEILMLRTFGYHKYKRNPPINIPCIDYESFETRSTKATTNDHYLYYSDTKYLKLNMINKTPRIISSVPLFQHINSLVIYMPIKCSSSSNNSLNIGKNRYFF